MKPASLWMALLFSALCVTGCNKDGATSDDPKSGQAKAGIRDPENIKQLKELKTTDVKIGTGQTVKTGDTVYMAYTGKLKNGIQFDSNDTPDGVPITFALGSGRMIKGWDKGIVGMKVGGIRKLDVPNAMAYGNNERSDKLPAGADLYFEVKLLDAIVQGEETYFDKTDIKLGTGRDAKMGDLVEVNYVMRLVNGKKVDDFSDKTAPVVFRIGPKIQEKDREVPKGIYAAMVGMKEGGVRKMRVPPAIGYAYSSNTKLPPGHIVVVEMTLIKVL